MEFTQLVILAGRTWSFRNSTRIPLGFQALVLETDGKGREGEMRWPEKYRGGMQARGVMQQPFLCARRLHMGTFNGHTLGRILGGLSLYSSES